MLNGNPINPKETVILQPGDIIALNTPGGAGYGKPLQRDWERVTADVASGVVSEALAREVYQWAG
jgi:N-methylhydantoinase B/oxoprolinase/acetone carboxylase alpha subunit